MIARPAVGPRVWWEVGNERGGRERRRRMRQRERERWSCLCRVVGKRTWVGNLSEEGDSFGASSYQVVGQAGL